MQFKLKSGTSKGNRRIWIEGPRLVESGFRKGMKLHRTMYNDCLTLTIEPTAKSTRKHSISGTTPERPVLDLTGKWVTELMGNSEQFQVTIDNDKTITIQPV